MGRIFTQSKNSAVKFPDPVKPGPHIGQHQVKHGNGRHGFDNDDGAGDDDGVVAALDRYVDLAACLVHGCLYPADGGGGLHGDAKDDR